MQSGAAKVHFSVRLGFAKEALYFLETGNLWSGGATTPIPLNAYKELTREMEDAEKDPGKEVAIPGTWETVVPTSLVRLRMNAKLPAWVEDGEGSWTESAKTSDDAES